MNVNESGYESIMDLLHPRQGAGRGCDNAADNHPIRIEKIAEKLERVRNFGNEALREELTTQPRLKEALLLLQYVSLARNYEGGLRKFTADFIEDSRDLLGTATMRKHADAKEFTPEVARSVWADLSRDAKYDIGVEWLNSTDGVIVGEEGEEELRQMIDEDNATRLARITKKAVQALCIEEARKSLRSHLAALCERTDVCFHWLERQVSFSEPRFTGAPWYFVRLAEALLRFMDRHEEREAKKTADTATRREVFAWLDRTRQLPERGSILKGDSRSGKTHPVKVHARMYPGRERLVTRPRAVAKASCCAPLEKRTASRSGHDSPPGDSAN